MRKKIALLLALLLLAGMLAACGGTRTADLHPLLWRVTDAEGHQIYLFGTIHLGDERNDRVLEKVSPYLEECDALAVEFDVLAYEKNVAAAVEDYQQFVYTDGSTIRDHMPEEMYNQCVELLEKVEAYSPLIDHYNLAMWSQLVQQAVQMTMSPLDSEKGMDRLLIQTAYDRQIPVWDVESASFQMAMLNSFPDELYLLQI